MREISSKGMPPRNNLVRPVRTAESHAQAVTPANRLASSRSSGSQAKSNTDRPDRIFTLKPALQLERKTADIGADRP